MKKIVTGLMVVIMGASLCGCGASPTSAAASFLDAVKSQDSEAVTEVYEGGDIDLLSVAADSEDEEKDSDSALNKVYEESMVPKLLDFDYEIKGEEIDGDKATVEVTIKTYKLGDAMTNFYTEYLTQAFALAFSDVSDEKLEEMGANIMKKEMDKLEDKSYEKTAKLHLVKKDDKWVVKKLTSKSEIVDAITGGMVSAFDSINSMWGE